MTAGYSCCQRAGYSVYTLGPTNAAQGLDNMAGQEYRKLGYRWLVSPTGSVSALSRPGLDHLGSNFRTLLIHNIRITLFCFVLHLFLIYIFTCLQTVSFAMLRKEGI